MHAPFCSICLLVFSLKQPIEIQVTLQKECTQFSHHSTMSLHGTVLSALMLALALAAMANSAPSEESKSTCTSTCTSIFVSTII